MNESRPVNMPPVVRFLGSLVRGAKDLLERGESKMEKGIEVAMHDIEVAMHDVDIDVNMKLLLCFISIGYFLGVVFVMLSPAPPRPSATKSARSKSKAKELEQEDREKRERRRLRQLHVTEPGQERVWEAPTAAEADEAAKNNKPASLVRRWIIVTGYAAPGQVLAWEHRYLYNSHHRVAFLDQSCDPGASTVRTVLLRRRRRGAWNRGLPFRLLSDAELQELKEMQQQQQQQQVKKQKHEEEERSAASRDPPPGGKLTPATPNSCGPAPKALESYIAPVRLRSMIAINTDLNAAENAAGHPWSLEIDRDGARVWSSASGVSSARLFRVSIVLDVDGLDLHECMFWLSLYERRRRYDDSLTSTRYIRKFDEKNGSQFDVVRYTTKTEAGGLISPRVFTDVRVFFPERTPGNEVFGASVAFDGKKTPLPSHFSEGSGDGRQSFASPLALSANEARCTAACNLPGGGIRMTKIKGNDGGAFRVRVTMTGLSELGGWLPTSIVNSATTSVFHKIATSFARQLGTIKGAECRIVVTP